MFNRLPPIDLTSFWLGFLFTSAFWLVVTRIIRLIPKLRATIKQNRIIQKSKLEESGELLLRKSILRRCQSAHLASTLFSLNSIYIDLPLILPPVHQDPLKDPSDKSIIQKIIPYIPECPELLVDIPIATISLAAALGHFENVAILGEFGSGKSTALAAFASKIIEKDPSVSEFHSMLPLFMHISELEVDQSQDSTALDAFRNSSLPARTKITFETFQEIIVAAEESNKLLILLDGMDELDEPNFLLYATWIKLFQQTYPSTRFIVTAGSNFVDGLEGLGFTPCFMSPLHSGQHNQLISRWTTACREITNAHNDQKSEEVPLLWLSQEENKSDIFHTTLNIWAHLLSLLATYDQPNWVENYLKYFAQQNLQKEDLVKISETIFFSKQSGISKKELLAFVKLPEVEVAPGNTENGAISEVNSVNSLSMQQIENNLLESGLFVERKIDHFHFNNPVLLAALLSQSTRFPLQKNWNILLKAPLSELVLRLSPQSEYIRNWVNSSDAPIYRNFQLVSRHLSKLPSSSEDRKIILQEISRLSVKKELPLSIRARLLLAFSLSDDPSYLMLFKYLFNQKDAVSRQVAVLGFSLRNSNENFQQILLSVDDPNNSVSTLATVLLSRFWTIKNQKPFIDLLLNGSETIRRIISELLAYQPGDGIEILKELSTVDNIASRKSAIYGLRLINEPWVRPLLEKISIDDKQWVVRDAAIHALEILNEDPFAASISPSAKPSETPWLIQFASKTGQGISPNSYPYDLLYKAIDTSVESEVLSAIQFLASNPDPEAIKELGILTEKESTFRDSAADALMTIARRGK